MAGMIDFLRALAAQGAPSQGVPFNQLVSGDAPMGQQIAQSDNLSPLEQYLARQKMLQARGQTSISTIDPGKYWGGLDKNNVDSDGYMSESVYARPYRQDSI